MIERQIVQSNVNEFKIQEYITSTLKNLGHSHIKLQKTPLGEKIIIYASRPGLIVGRKGQNIRQLTSDLKKKFNLENPQIEINEIEQPNLDAQIIAERIANSLEKFGSQRFKGVGHRVMSDVMGAGALGIEVLITGKIPSSRAKRWRFYQGYLKKCGDIAIVGVRTAYAVAELKTGTVGIQVRIMPSETKLPDDIQIIEELQEEISEEDAEANTIKKVSSKSRKKDEKEGEEKKRKPRKKAVKKKAADESAEQEAVEARSEEPKAEDTPAGQEPAEQENAEQESVEQESESVEQDSFETEETKEEQ